MHRFPGHHTTCLPRTLNNRSTSIRSLSPLELIDFLTSNGLNVVDVDEFAVTNVASSSMLLSGTDARITAAIIAASASIIVSIGSTIFNRFGLNSQAELTARLDRETKIIDQRLIAKEKAEEEKKTAQALVNKARRPILKSAIDLLSRIHNIQHRSFFWYLSVPERKELALLSTAYEFARFWCLSNTLYNEVDLLGSDDYDDPTSEPEIISNLLDAISRQCSTDRFDRYLMMWGLEQRAVGDLMLDDEGECIGLDAFIEKYNSNSDLGLGKWLKNFVADLEKLGTNGDGKGSERLTEVGKALSILILQLARSNLQSQRMLTQYILRMMHSYHSDVPGDGGKKRIFGNVATITKTMDEDYIETYTVEWEA